MECVSTEWFECSVDVPVECADAVANFLMENGAPGVQSEDGGHLITLTAYFLGAPPLDALRCFCTDIGSPLGEPTGVRVRQIPQEDWAENWKAHFAPQVVGDRLRICPPWDAGVVDGRIMIVINPGMAFGTGQHATTRGCLLLLERARVEQHAARALDVGTGSGVLAIALAKLGLADVWAIDTDPTACAIAAINVRENGVDAEVSIAGGLDEVPGVFDLIAANLFANLLNELAAQLADRLNPGGVFVCSGFLTNDEPRVRSAYEARGLQLTSRHEQQSWVTLALRRPTRR